MSSSHCNPVEYACKVVVGSLVAMRLSLTLILEGERGGGSSDDAEDTSSTFPEDMQVHDLHFYDFKSDANDPNTVFTLKKGNFSSAVDYLQSNGF
tara:strand:+ start:3854 stop:4138 length:285 start_codon:yes stop_codon:yes gene_type:complete